MHFEQQARRAKRGFRESRGSSGFSVPTREDESYHCAGRPLRAGFVLPSHCLKRIASSHVLQNTSCQRLDGPVPKRLLSITRASLPRHMTATKGTSFWQFSHEVYNKTRSLPHLDARKRKSESYVVGDSALTKLIILAQLLCYESSYLPIKSLGRRRT